MTVTVLDVIENMFGVLLLVIIVIAILAVYGGSRDK